MKKIMLLFTSLIVVFTFAVTISSYNTSDTVVYEGFETGSKLSDDHVFTTTDENGNVTEMDVETMEEEVAQEISEREKLSNSPMPIGGTTNIENGVVNFKTKANSTINTYYTEDGTNRSGYLNGYYAADGAFLGYNNDGSKVKFMQAGVIGWVAANEVEILDYDDESVVKSINYYQVKDGKIFHYGTTNLKGPYYSMVNMVGYKQSYMSNNGIYYSYDGHYFYKTYAQMIKDYKNNTRINSINPSSPYYNYYQFLSHRTKTNITAEMLNNYVNKMTTKSTSKMKNMGQYFIQYQNEYGSNALLMFGVAANESAWGNSSIAQAKNNLFGHAAYDDSAGSSANGYFNPQLSIYSHARYFVSEGYLDPLDYSGRYYGAHLGDKASGMNVKYASDPYWGEKAAEIAWLVADANASVKDNEKYTIAIKEKGSSLNVRSEATTSSYNLYSTGTVGDYPFIVLDTVSGQSVNGNKKWYKIQSDSTLNSNRTEITRDSGAYDFNKYYAYVSSEYANIIKVGSNGSESGDSGDSGTIVKGDVNGNGKIDAADYLMVMDNILGKFTLNNEQKTKGDVNGNGKIDAADYLMIMDSLLGKITIN